MIGASDATNIRANVEGVSCLVGWHLVGQQGIRVCLSLPTEDAHRSEDRVCESEAELLGAEIVKAFSLHSAHHGTITRV